MNSSIKLTILDIRLGLFQLLQGSSRHHNQNIDNSHEKLLDSTFLAC